MLSTSRFAAGLALLAGFAGAMFAQPLLAPTPPMGWNSWDSFGTGVTEAEVKANADYMASKLAKAGWQYISISLDHGIFRPGILSLCFRNAQVKPLWQGLILTAWSGT